MKIKILHTADLHLDSSMTSYLPREKAKERKQELLIAFENMVKYAADEGIAHILIAGDLFDKKVLTEKVVRFAENVFVSHPNITFYYLKGNHDSDGFLDRIEVPHNLLTFSGDKWDRYIIETEGKKKICIYGTELKSDTQPQMLTALQPEEEDINIVMLHGQDAEAAGKDKEIRIDIPRLKGKAIDYLALGHVHKPRIERLDSRGVISYPGCLEGRGYDECGDRGFNVLTADTDTGNVTVDFVFHSIRRVLEERVDVSGVKSSAEALTLVRNTLEKKINQDLISSKDIVKVILTGDLAVDAEIDSELISKQTEGIFYYLKTVDGTGRIIDFNEYRNDVSLKGEFVRQVEKDSSLSESEKADIIRTGILLLAGRKEEV